MTSLKNAIEELVVIEVQEQLKHLHPAIRETINLSEATAYALNRLPVLYASTSRGWLQQRKRANSEFRSQITKAVQQALLGIKRDPIRKATQIAASRTETPAHVLAKLQKLLGEPNLAWQDVPQALQKVLSLVSHQSEYTGLSVSDRHRLHEIKGYLERRGKPNGKQTYDYKERRDWHISSELPNPELNSYIISASYALTNVLEDLVKQEVNNQMRHMAGVLPRKVSINDVCAHALNRLPPMYATTEQGVAWQTNKAKEQMASQIESTVIQSLLTLSRTPRRFNDPLPLLKFDEECEHSLSNLRQIFQRDDIIWQNIAILAEYAIEQEKQGKVNWRQQWRMLGQIYSEMYLKPGDAELFLQHSPKGDILIVRALNRDAFGWLADNPKNLGISALRLFPAISEIDLFVDFLDFSITYTREEMAADGII
ncbi:MAG: late competence development ComFB family protein [Pseudanabaenaceae cyanobacterium bins.39]|nr:late competence development ComFB family protein [Pseudanabaenaceae cyanobacterium bins.39]